MEEKEIKAIEYEIQNLMRLRDNCINFIALITGGCIGFGLIRI